MSDTSTTPQRIVPGSIVSEVASFTNDTHPTVENMAATEQAVSYGMKVRRPIDIAENNELMTIAALRDGLPEGAEVVEGSWRASWMGYITVEEPYDELIAVDVRGFLFPYVHRYENRQGTRTRIVGEWWSASVLVWPSSLPEGADS